MFVIKPVSVHAWWSSEHEVIAYIADTKLTPKTKKALHSLLQIPITKLYSRLITPSIQRRLAHLSEKSNNLILASIFADQVKKKKYQNKFQKSFRLFDIHYININIYPNSSTQIKRQFHKSLTRALLKSGKDNVYCAIKTSIITLVKNHNKDQKRALALRMLIHLIGDIHQPLHVANPVLFNVDTRGGNLIRLVSDYKYKKRAKRFLKLHQIWDNSDWSIYIKQQSPDLLNSNKMHLLMSDVKHQGSKLIKQYKNNIKLYREAQDPNIISWMFKDYKIINFELNNWKAYKYTGKIIKLKLSRKHKIYIKNTSFQQIYLAGNRLSYILNAIFDEKRANPKYINYIEKMKVCSN